MKRLFLCTLVAASGLGVAYAQENQTYRCERGDDRRTIAVEYAADGTGCSILYKKVAASPEPARELWHYGAHRETCAVTAEGFVKKLEGLGLTCAPAKD